MENNTSKFILKQNGEKFEVKSNKAIMDIKFNRIAFLFFLFFLISLIYSIHLFHLGSRDINSIKSNNFNSPSKSQRADIIDREGVFLAKTVSSIDIGINPVEIIDKKKNVNKFKIYLPQKRL